MLFREQDGTGPDLVADYFLRDLSAEELEQLQDQLRNCPDARKRFAEAGSQEWLLSDLHHADEVRMVHFTPRRARSRRIRAIAAGVALLLTIGTLYTARHTQLAKRVAADRDAVVVARVADCYVLDGTAISVVNDGRVGKLGPRSTIHSGDHIHVPEGCRLSFTYLNESTRIEASGGTMVAVADDGGAKRLFLRKGGLAADVAKQQPGKPMRLATPDAEAEVLGTSFELLVSGSTRLYVSSGCVRFLAKEKGSWVDVAAGFTADTASGARETGSYQSRRFHPVVDGTPEGDVDPRFIAVDPERNYTGMLRFELGELGGRIIEARLRLRVMRMQLDYGGSGDVRLFIRNLRAGMGGGLRQVAHYCGNVGGDMDLEFEIDPDALGDGACEFQIRLDTGGNDFWFSSSRGSVPPELLLKIETKETGEGK